MPKRHTQNLCEELNQIMAHLGKTSTKGLKKGFSPHSPDGAVICCDLVTIQFRGSVVTSDAGLLARIMQRFDGYGVLGAALV